MRTLVQYALYFLGGLVSLWLLLLYWGVSAGAANAMPYFVLVADLVVVLLATALSLYLEKPAALVALIAGMVGLAWPIGILLTGGSVIEALVVGALPLALSVDGLVRLVQRRGAPWLRLTGGLAMPLRLLLTALPVGVVASLVNVEAVVFLLRQGPPGW